VSPDDAGVIATWATVLDDLDAHVFAAGRAHGQGQGQAQAGSPGGAGSTPAGPSPWSPPAGLGPLPADLAVRAADLLAEQRSVTARLADHRYDVLKQLGAVRAVERSQAPERPVYLDTAG